jgi:predicted esterase
MPICHTILRRTWIVSLFMLSAVYSSAQFPSGAYDSLAPNIMKQTFTFAQRDSITLKLDVYKLADTPPQSTCVLFVFGGGFMTGSRDHAMYNHYFNTLVKNNYVVISISYRLGLKGVRNLSKLNVTPLKNAINMAVEDLFDATHWIITHAGEIGIDSSRIVLSGSSAGAITVLQGDFEKRNQTSLSKKLPEAFQYAGVVAFSGAILSYDGALRYKIPPSPTMLFHGTEDRLVIYNKIRLFKKGLYGSSHVAKIFRKNNYPYYIWREEGMGHEVSVSPMNVNTSEILWFMQEYIQNKKPYQTDVRFNNMKKVRTFLLDRNDVYK